MPSLSGKTPMHASRSKRRRRRLPPPPRRRIAIAILFAVEVGRERRQSRTTGTTAITATSATTTSDANAVVALLLTRPALDLMAIVKAIVVIIVGVILHHVTRVSVASCRHWYAMMRQKERSKLHPINRVVGGVNCHTPGG